MPRKDSRNTKGRIVESAWELFYEQGYENTTIDDIVEHSETSKGSFYHYFDSKDALLSSLSYLFDNKYDELIPTLETYTSAADKLIYLNHELFLMIENKVPLDLLARLLSTQLVTSGEKHLLDHNRTYYRLLRKITIEAQKILSAVTRVERQYRSGLGVAVTVRMIIVDENAVSDFSKGLDKLKAVITKDVVSVNEKYVKEFDYRFNGLVIECVNDMVNTADKTNSFLRRLHIVPFDKTFVGNPKKYIKDRLIYMEEVKEYIVKMAMVDMPYFDTFTKTAATKKALAAYLDATNSAVAYLNEILPLVQWDLLPAQDFLYAGFKTWYKNCHPSGKVCGRADFYDTVRAYVNSSAVGTEWEWTDSCRSNGYIDPMVKEPLLVDLELVEFINPIHAPGNPQREYPDVRKIKAKYSGLKRRIPSAAAGAVNGTTVTPTDTEEN